MGSVEAGDVSGMTEVGRCKERGTIDQTETMWKVCWTQDTGVLARVCREGVWGGSVPPSGVQMHVCGIQAGEGSMESVVGLRGRRVGGDWVRVKQV